MERKYEFTGDVKRVDGHILHRIRALRDFGEVKAGDLGGWIEKEDNLSHNGSCWVAGEACVFGYAVVEDDAQVLGLAKVFDHVIINDRAVVCGTAVIKGLTSIGGESFVSGSITLDSQIRISGSATISGREIVFN